jgi:YidC/Oxa1 family membrane protein insertase
MLPLFKAVHSFIPNYGIAIIVFSILMKILLTPLSLKQLRNASYMRLLTPEITKVREQYPDDRQKQQMETMALYTKYGINPASGCLPLLIQMPILFAL